MTPVSTGYAVTALLGARLRGLCRKRPVGTRGAPVSNDNERLRCRVPSRQPLSAATRKPWVFVRRSNDAFCGSRHPTSAATHRGTDVTRRLSVGIAAVARALVHRFRSSYHIAALSVYELRNQRCTSNSMILARLRLRPTRRVDCFYHSGGLGSPIDAFQTTVKRQLGLPSCF